MVENKKSSPLLAKLPSSGTAEAGVANAPTDFAAIMAEQGYQSVFDIIR
ncbi:hypothetical protein [Mycoavidus sp. SF9855]|nr:hypothetical protein [Mycoavidus sp. SF9855]UUM22268.1 hypothetical protein NQD60_04180 [Mycoavidus sp. SF9855]